MTDTDKPYRIQIRGSVTIRVPFKWTGEVSASDAEMLDDWEALAGSAFVEGAIQDAITDSMFDIDTNDIEIDSAKRIHDAAGGSK